MATESVDEILSDFQNQTVIIDSKVSVLGPEEDARAFEASKKTAKQRLDAYYTRECAKKVLEGNVKYVTGWLNWARSGGGHITRTQLEESLAELRATIQEVGGGE